MRVRVQASGMVRLLVMCGLIAELALAQAAPASAAAAPRGATHAVRAAIGQVDGTAAATHGGAGGTATTTGTTGTGQPSAPLPVRFEPNQGQTDPRVLFLAHGRGYTLFLTARAAVLTLAQERPLTSMPTLTATPALTAAVVQLWYPGANASVPVDAQDPLPGATNYLRGNDPAGWHTGIPGDGRVTYHGLYPGIDLVYDGRGGHLETSYVVAPGADPSLITLAMSGTRGLRLDAGGGLALATAAGDLRQSAPVAYQDAGGPRRAVPVRYGLDGAGHVTFTLGHYDASQPLVIDPVLSYSTYLGGTGSDKGTAIAVDATGAAYVTGNTTSPNFPTRQALQNGYGGGYSGDAFVTKLTPGGSALVYSTYLGGSGDDTGSGIAVDAAGDAYVAGTTASTDFPTKNALQAANAGGRDAFVAKLSPSGSALLWSTYLGGNSDDWGNAIALDAAGDPVVVGTTGSTTFPTKNALQGSPKNGRDAFVTKLAADGSALLWSTYYGGSGDDYGNGVALDPRGTVYLAGQTASADFPLKNAVQARLGGGYNGDAFVAALSADGSASVYSTYLGGSANDTATAIAADATGAAYVTGATTSPDFPTKNALQPGFGGGYKGDAFVSKVSPGGGSLVWSTYLGGNGDDYGNGIALDSQDNVYVTGNTGSPNFPLASPAQSTYTGSGPGCYSTPCGDAFVSKLSADGAALSYSTYLGGSSATVGLGIAVDVTGTAYATGYTYAPDFPTTAGAAQGLSGGGSGQSDAFVTAFLGLGSGDVPWHPHSGGPGAIGGGVDVRVDLADGHVDVGLAGLSIPGRGPDLTVNRTWDSALAQGGTSGLSSSLTPTMGGALQGTVVYTDGVGTVWAFPYTGSATATPPYTAYRTPAGQPWQLATSTAGYTLTNFLTSEVWSFDAQGRLQSDTDSYGNRNSMSYGAGSPTSPSSAGNSGGRALTLGYTTGQLTAVQSPAWASSGGAQGQQVTYGYNGAGQLTGMTRGAGSTDAVTTTLGYSGTLLTRITTPSGRAWGLGYDAAGRVVALTSPVAGTAGQPGYTPAYTTGYSYSVGQTVVVQGVGTSAALTTTHTLDGQGQPITVTDGLGHSSGATYDADHNVLTSADANGHTTTNTYQYIGPNGYSGPLDLNARSGR